MLDTTVIFSSKPTPRSFVTEAGKRIVLPTHKPTTLILNISLIGQSDVAVRNLGKKWFPCEMQYAGFPLNVIIIENFDNYNVNGNLGHLKI